MNTVQLVFLGESLEKRAHESTIQIIQYRMLNVELCPLVYRKAFIRKQVDRGRWSSLGIICLL